MRRKQRFRAKLFYSYFSIFLLFTLFILAYQYNREKEFRTEMLDSRLKDVACIVDNFIKQKPESVISGRELDTLVSILPLEEVRVTIISVDGKVIYDSSVKQWDQLENHLQRPEVSKSHYSDYGTAIRESASTGKKYYYFSKYFDKYYVRLAVEYNIRIIGFLKSRKLFLLFIALTFILIWWLLNVVTKKMSDSINTLRDYTLAMHKGDKEILPIKFPDNEIGDIGHEIADIYNDIKKNSTDLALQREKLFKHLQILNEGVAFFSPKREVTLSNNLFVHFLNAVSGEHTINPGNLLQLPQFEQVKIFLDNHSVAVPALTDSPRIEYHIEKSSRYYLVRCILFHDLSYEIILTDVTQTEQNKVIRQQMTSNIAHELKTPVASIRGYLETLQDNTGMDDEKKDYFLKKAILQSERLTDLINDIVILNKLDESGSSFPLEEIEVASIVKDISDSLQTIMKKKKINLVTEIEPEVKVTANRSLVYSIFQNLMENSINYAGENITITIKNLKGEEGFHLFSFSDNGAGIPEEHQPRIFERFYRVDPGRSRKSGGTGLGLAIVKNAVLLHRGEISVRTRQGGGAEFIFSLPK